MKKEHYELTETEIITFTTEEAILSSPLEEDELPVTTKS